MYAQVVVQTFQSPQIDSYIYEIPKELEGKVKVGQLVSVPFGKRSPTGIIVYIVDQPSTIVQNIRQINSILLSNPILLPYQIGLLKFMSAYYLAPMASCLNAMLPPLPNAKSLTTKVNAESGFGRSSLVVSQTLVLVPSINRLPEILANYPSAKNYVIYHNELKVSEKFATWQKILSGGYDFIFGSRSAIFTPCPNLKKIIIFDEHAGAYKDERSPYFDTLTIAEEINNLTGAKIEIIDSSPRIATYFNHKNSITIPQNNVPTKTISMTAEKVFGNYSPISQTLEEIIKRAHLKKLSMLLFLNKKRESGSVYCKNCKTQTFIEKQPAACLNCGSAEIYFNSININSLGQDVKKILPGVNINHIAEGVRSINNSQPSIVTIATASVFYKLSPRKYDVVAHIKTDTALNIADFSSGEKLYTQISNLKKLARKLLILQTYNTENPIIQNASKNNYQKFLKEELIQRKNFSYPPFSLLLKIIVHDKSKDTLESKAEKLFEDLNNLAKARDIEVIGPYQSHKDDLRYNIILKIKLENYNLGTRKDAIKKVANFLPQQKGIKIIIEPDSLT